MNFEILSEITNIEKIAVGNTIKEIDRLQKMYGKGHWKKMKGNARIKLENGVVRLAELY